MCDAPFDDEGGKRAAKHLVATAVYVYFETLCLSVALIAYGTLTFVFGDELWMAGESGVYDSANQVPMAPESWGVAFLIAGVGVALGNLYGRWNRLLSISAMLAGFLFLFFSISFLLDAIEGSNVAFPPFVIYGILAALCVNRSRLSWIWSEPKDSSSTQE